MRDESFQRALATILGVKIAPRAARSVSGGSINRALRYETDGGPIFVKRAGADALAMFAAEADGLKVLADAQAVRVPKVLGTGTCANEAFLALEWIEFGIAHRRSEATLGEQLARQHHVTVGRFGWSRDNTIGSTPQLNAWCEDWVRFFADRRLGFQLDLAARSSAAARVVERGRLLCASVGSFFSGYRPVPSLLHGDLWGGNWNVDARGEPVVFDPAVYFGDREADIAMTRLFGGFGRELYAAYESAWPLHEGAEVRCALYNLYHVLNHYNLFGGGYLAQAHAMIERLLAELA